MRLSKSRTFLKLPHHQESLFLVFYHPKELSFFLTFLCGGPPPPHLECPTTFPPPPASPTKAGPLVKWEELHYREVEQSPDFQPTISDVFFLFNPSRYSSMVSEKTSLFKLLPLSGRMFFKDRLQPRLLPPFFLLFQTGKDKKFVR